MKQPVVRSEAVLVIAACWVGNGLGYGVFAALDEPQPSMAPLIRMGPARWFFARHRCWRAAIAAGFTGTAVLSGLMDVLRPGLDKYVADALATGAAVTVALTVFTLAGRASGRSQDSASRLRPDLALSPTGCSPAAPLSAGTRQCAVDDAARQAPVRKA
ncbi:hypothetical protein GCM10010415_70710 [Streptomyces atrovirens]